MERAAFLNAAYEKQKATVQLLRKKLKTERKLKRRERRKRKAHEYQTMRNEKQTLIETMQSELARTQKSLARRRKTHYNANEKALDKKSNEHRCHGVEQPKVSHLWGRKVA